ncbi:septum site-determining protein MinC [Lacticaseibacillus chiayiensis]|uniref:Septum site-determining protein MinC n=1 Tax=Lacticaseibacillus chiayiensis TaxID=2100821 RepID=A0A4Q1UGK5_9LACO|nr:septum site-determining protein MinC [Lacticaseibacillus chiayiensis]QVI35733.1 septum site-determining protein MinC [Lacticaseibacillus chiayiensis]RXT30225.1 septum site-determining protein MinC [Lacticaseibacillus chiayiensis]UYN57567.1 septum site-determining protein MinC [Lacticaseibacillus chiayiensis]
MDSVVLKGRNDSLALQLRDTADFMQIIRTLKTLLGKLYEETPTGEVSYRLETGNRLLTEEQLTQIQSVFADFPRFSINGITSAVVDKDVVADMVTGKMTHRIGGVVRSGQTIDIMGDVLFLGDLHSGATLCASGNIFVMGKVSGVVQAGSHGDTRAVVVGDLQGASQVRIADVIEIVADHYDPLKPVAYLSKLHTMTHAKMSELANIRPRLFKQMEAM